MTPMKTMMRFFTKLAAYKPALSARRRKGALITAPAFKEKPLDSRSS